MTYRIVQWTTGNVGKRSVRAIVQNPEMELVGCYAWSDHKVGHDVGELCGIAPLGITATNKMDELLALKPDCVVYNPMWPNVDELAAILAAGVNVVSTAAFITGHYHGDDGRAQIVSACERGGSTIFGSGINPGFAQYFAIVTAGLSDRIDKICVTESADTTIYNSPPTEIPMGFGQPIDNPELPAVIAEGTRLYRDAVILLAEALGVELDDIRCDAEVAQTTEDLHLPGDWTIHKGCVAGIDVRWKGYVADKDVIEVRSRWRKGQSLEPDWQFNQMGYTVQVLGHPTVTSTLDFLPPPDFQFETVSDFLLLGLVITAMPSINAIPAVIAAPPGITTYTDLAPILPRGALRAETS